jgi:hypothetical protein
MFVVLSKFDISLSWPGVRRRSVEEPSTLLSMRIEKRTWKALKKADAMDRAVSEY